MPQQSRLTVLLTELQRRREFRVAEFCGGIASVIVQIFDGAFDVMSIPPWTWPMNPGTT